MNQFSELIKKLAEDSTKLTPTEKQELYLQARQLEQAAVVATDMVIPGTSTLRVDNAIINNANVNAATINRAVTGGTGTVILDTDGISIVAPAAQADVNSVKFLDGANVVSYVSGWITDDTNSLDLKANAAQEVVVTLLANSDTRGAVVAMGYDGVSTAQVVVDTSGGAHVTISPSIFMTETTTPTNTLTANADAQIYIRNDKLIVKYNDAGTTRYKYLDLTGTGVTWVHDTVAP